MSLPVLLQAAVGLATEFFPAEQSTDGVRRTTSGAVCFVLDGHVDAWDRWPSLSEDDSTRFGRLWRYRRNELANSEFAAQTLENLLMTDRLKGCSPAPDFGATGVIEVAPGFGLREFVDLSLDEAEESRTASRCLPVAAAGPHTAQTRLAGAQAGSGRVIALEYEILPHHVDGLPAAPQLHDAEPLPRCSVPLADLSSIAARLDSAEGRARADGNAYRTNAVERFRQQIRAGGGVAVDELDLAAGQLNELLAYTGFGKSVVLIECLACWAVERGVSVSFLLPTNAEVLRAAARIEHALEVLAIDGSVTPLMSPRSMFEEAEKADSRPSSDGPGSEWLWTKLGYGCALSAVAMADEAVDCWQPGAEPCRTLRVPAHGRRREQTVSCPWRTSCDKFKLVRAACAADVIVTSHSNFQVGRLQTPVEDGRGISDQMTVEELILRRSQVVVIDEVDTFQRMAVKQAGRGLELDQARKTDTVLRTFDREFGANLGQLGEEVDARVRDALYLVRYLAENYVSHMTYSRLDVAAPDYARRPGPTRHWIVPRRWDSWLTARLFNLPEDVAVTAQQLVMFRSLFLDGDDIQADEPAVFAQIRRHLADVCTAGHGGTAIATARAELDHALEGLIADERDVIINRLIRRAILERIRVNLHRLMANSPQLVAAGIESTQTIADALGPYGRWRVTPTGPLGRLLFAFTEYHDETGRDVTRLTSAAFGGDPHVYVTGLGDTTSLALARLRRIVVGLSATAYFPLAPHHHVQVEPRWWVRDDNPGSVTIRTVRVRDDDGRVLRISGVDGRRRHAVTQELARRLWDQQLAAELQRLRRDDPDRARVLLATTSYVGARHVAEGLAMAGVAPNRICLAVQPTAEWIGSADSPAVDTGRWRELPADRIEDFAALDGSDVLIAPLARVQRGVNIIGAGDRSALGSVWLIVRPIPLLDEPDELVAHLQARALLESPAASATPLEVLAERRDIAGNYFEEIVRRPPYFSSQPRLARLGVIAEILNGAIQLIGRARRGGTPAALHLVDGAFHDASTGPDFPALVRMLFEEWDGLLVGSRMSDIYGTTLEAFREYANRVESKEGL
ncbi:hypothetical protein ABZX12_41115 [Kribbella sp. NPDC003505]|uniref:hypothetical protein n=1 Tax=Kribbella sp. NPDC003505 TaxID=3154448 RepID=UPI0033BA5887